MIADIVVVGAVVTVAVVGVCNVGIPTSAHNMIDVSFSSFSFHFSSFDTTALVPGADPMPLQYDHAMHERNSLSFPVPFSQQGSSCRDRIGKVTEQENGPCISLHFPLWVFGSTCTSALNSLSYRSSRFHCAVRRQTVQLGDEQLLRRLEKEDCLPLVLIVGANSAKLIAPYGKQINKIAFE